MAIGPGKRRIIAGMSGAQAAAGDLLRARASETAAEERDPAKIAAASAVFNGFETYYKAQRTYQPGHPALERFFAQLDEKLRATLTRYEDLSVEVTARGLELDGEAVFTAERPDTNMWFPLYRDGIRELTLFTGIDHEQITRFCKALAKLAQMRSNEDSDDGEDDAVTSLWDLELEHVGYVAIDTFTDGSTGDEESKRRVERIREIITLAMMKEVVVPAHAGRPGATAERLKSIALGKADVDALARENLVALDELPPRVREAQGDIFVVDPAERDAFTRGLGRDPDLIEKLLDGIVHALFASGGTDEYAQALCDRIERAFAALIKDDKLVRAAKLRSHVVSVSRGAPDAALVARIDRAMASEAALAAIVSALVQRPDDTVIDVVQLIAVMPPSSARVIVAGLGKVEQRRRRRAACDAMAHWGAPIVEAVAAALPDTSEDVALDLLYLLRQSNSDQAAVALERATHHASATIRAGALRLYIEIAPPVEVEKRCRLALRDPAPLVRAAGLEAIVARRPDGALRWIKEAVDADAFADLELGEKTRLLVGYALVGGSAVAADLRQRLDQRNLLGRAGIDDIRIAAATALGQLRDTEARPLLEKLAGARMTRETVKIACVQALKVIDLPPERARTPSSAPMFGERARTPSSAPLFGERAHTPSAPPVDRSRMTSDATQPIDRSRMTSDATQPIERPHDATRPIERPRMTTPQGSQPLDRPRGSTPQAPTQPIERPRASSPDPTQQIDRPRSSTPQGSQPLDRPRSSTPPGTQPIDRPRSSTPPGTQPIERPRVPAPDTSRSRTTPPGSQPLDRPRVPTPQGQQPLDRPRVPTPQGQQPIARPPPPGTVDPPTIRLRTPSSAPPLSRPATPIPDDGPRVRSSSSSPPLSRPPTAPPEAGVSFKPRAQTASPDPNDSREQRVDSRSASGRRPIDDESVPVPPRRTKPPPKKDGDG